MSIKSVSIRIEEENGIIEKKINPEVNVKPPRK